MMILAVLVGTILCHVPIGGKWSANAARPKMTTFDMDVNNQLLQMVSFIKTVDNITMFI